VWRMEKKKYSRERNVSDCCSHRDEMRGVWTNVWRMEKKKIFLRTQRFGLLLPQRRNERRMDKCVAYGEKQNVLLKKSP
jgi:hypothetical protein